MLNVERPVKRIGFLSFGHHQPVPGSMTRTAGDALLQTIELAVAAEELGLRVPDDVAVTGWDDVMAARHARPGLTTVRQPMRQLGARAARRLHERLAGDTSDPRHEVLPTQLVVRRSCGNHHPEEDR